MSESEIREPRRRPRRLVVDGRRAMPTKHSVVVVAAVAAALGIFHSWSTPQPAARRPISQFLPFAELWGADRQFDDGDDQSNYANHPLLRARQNIVPKLNTIVRASWFHEPVIGVWEPITTMAKIRTSESRDQRFFWVIARGYAFALDKTVDVARRRSCDRSSERAGLGEGPGLRRWPATAHHGAIIEARIRSASSASQMRA